MKKRLTLMFTVLFVLQIIQPVFAENPYYIRINISTNCVTVYSSADNSPVKAMICSIGKDTPTGTYNTTQQLRWHALFGNEYGQYCTRITGHILFHSVPYYTQNNNDLNTQNYNALGVPDSMGCVRLTTADAKWIFDNCPLNTQVTFFYGSAENDPLGRPDALYLGKNAPFPTWDPTDPIENNPWASLKPTVTTNKKIRTIYIPPSENASSFIKILNADVYAYDTAGNTIAPSISCKPAPGKYGIYTVVYAVKDALGRTAELKTYTLVLPCAPNKSRLNF